MPIVLATADSPEFDFGGGSTVPAFEWWWWQYGASDLVRRVFAVEHAPLS